MKITLPVPPSVNAYWRIFRNRILLSQEARSYKLRALMVAKTQGHVPLEGTVRVSLVVYRKRKAGDLDNYFKATFDALRGVAFHDDSQVVEIWARRGEDSLNPRVEICVEQSK